jgi:hypothetical protein
MLPPMWGSLRGLARLPAVLVAGLLALAGVAVFVVTLLAPVRDPRLPPGSPTWPRRP